MKHLFSWVRYLPYWEEVWLFQDKTIFKDDDIKEINLSSWVPSDRSMQFCWTVCHFFLESHIWGYASLWSVNKQPLMCFTIEHMSGRPEKWGLNDVLVIVQIPEVILSTSIHQLWGRLLPTNQKFHFHLSSVFRPWEYRLMPICCFIKRTVTPIIILIHRWHQKQFANDLAIICFLARKIDLGENCVPNPNFRFFACLKMCFYQNNILLAV